MSSPAAMYDAGTDEGRQRQIRWDNLRQRGSVGYVSLRARRWDESGYGKVGRV